MSAFVLKIIALISMLIDHTGAVFPEYFGLEFRVIGRVAFPIFVFLVAEGFRYTKSPAKFLARLFVFAIISEPFFDLAFGNEVNFFARTNIFYTLFLGGVAICIHKFADKACRAEGATIGQKVRIICTAVVMFPFPFIAANALTTDYGAYGVVFIFAMYIIRNKALRIVAMVLLCLYQHQNRISIGLEHGFDVFPLLEWMLIPATLVPVILVAFYNGKRGRSLKWVFYVAYPAHLALFYAISILFVH